MGPYDPKNLAILWFTLANWNPWFKYSWQIADRNLTWLGIDL